MGKIEYYDVLRYFYDCWTSKLSYDKELRSKVNTKEDLKKWVERRASYMYRARCEYEFLMADWPFGCKQMYDDLKVFLPIYNIGDWDHDIKFCNIITRSMEKIDVYDQIMMNIDVIVDILYTEFKLDKKDENKSIKKVKKGS